MKAAGVFVACLFAAGACKTMDETTPDRAAGAPKAVQGDNRGVHLHCIGLQPPQRGSCDKGDPGVTALVLAARTQTQREEAIDLAMQMRIVDLPITERLIAQNAALYLGTIEWQGRIDALRLVRAMAVESDVLDKLGEKISPEIGAWLDDPAKWRDQKVREMPLQHEKQMRFTQWYRAVISGDTRAVVGQLIAVDKRWQPHITPLPGGFEALSPTPEDPSEESACVTEIDVEARRCGAAAGLEALMLLDPPPQQLMPFVLPYGGPNKANCKGCHAAPPNQFVEALGVEEAKAHLAARKEAFLKEARAQLARLQEILRQSSTR
jgi:hypothetical protein